MKNFNSKKEHYNTRVRKFAAAIESGITEHQRIAHNSPEQVKDTHDRRKLIEESVEKLIGKMEELRQANAGRIPSELSLEDVQEVERLSENVDCLSDYAACGAQDKRTEGRNQRFLTPNYVRTEKGDISTPVSSGTEPRLDMHSTQRAENQQLQKQEETKRMVIGGLVAAAGAITIGLGATALVATTAATGGIVLVVLGVGLFCFGLWYANRENKPGVFTRLGNGIQTGINGLKNGINGGRQARQIEREDWNSHHKVL